MWKKQTKTLENNCCVVYKKGKSLNYVYWANKNTNKLISINIKLPDNNTERIK